MKFIEPSYEILACPDGEDVLRLLEVAARVCYKSEGKIHPGKTRSGCREPRHRVGGLEGWEKEPSSYAMVRKILKSGHLSVIEHQSVTVRFVCNRGVSHELVRHRLCSFSQESTRYCNYGKGDTGLNIIEPSYRPSQPECKAETHQWGGADHPKDCSCDRRKTWEEALEHVERAYLRLLDLGEKPQQARDILPIGLKTEVVTTANLREWQHIFKLRCGKRAHPQIRELMVPLRAELRTRIPLIFDEVDG